MQPQHHLLLISLLLLLMSAGQLADILTDFSLHTACWLSSPRSHTPSSVVWVTEIWEGVTPPCDVSLFLLSSSPHFPSSPPPRSVGHLTEMW